MQFVAIDFETASRFPDSACSIGLVKMDEEGGVIERYYSLIRPRSLVFDPMCTMVHHLDPIDVAKAPTFRDQWPAIREFIGDLPLVAHNAPFDMNVLKSTLLSWGLEEIHSQYYDTLSLSRKLLKGKRRYKLTSLAQEYGWEYNAHNALEDAEICGRLFSRLCGSNLFDDQIARRFFRRLYRDGSYPRTV